MECIDYKPKIELLYLFSNWPNIWNYVNNKYIDKNSREIVYRYVHEILNTSDRLHMMNITTGNTCSYCGNIENNMHFMYFCPSAKHILTWFKLLLRKCCRLKTESWLKIFKLDFEAETKIDGNTAIVLLTDFISGMWYGRSMGLLRDDPNLILYIKNRMSKTKIILLESFSFCIYKLFTKTI